MDHRHPHTGHHDPSHPGPGYETRDANARSIAVFAAWLFVFLLVVHVALYGVYELFVRRSPPPQTVRSPDNIYEQLRSMRQSEEETLSTYGWVDRKAGVVRIPIERAIQLAAERGLPHGKGPRPEAEVNSHSGTPVKAEDAKGAQAPAPAPEEKKP